MLFQDSYGQYQQDWSKVSNVTCRSSSTKYDRQMDKHKTEKLPLHICLLTQMIQKYAWKYQVGKMKNGYMVTKVLLHSSSDTPRAITESHISQQHTNIYI